MGTVITLLIIIGLIAVLFIPQVRSNSISRWLLYRLSKQFITVSKTEREAIDAGSVGWERTIFRGAPNWKELIDISTAKLSDKEDQFIKNETSELCALADDWQIQQEKDLTVEAWSFAKNKGFFGLNIPSDYGGLGFSAFAQSAVITKLATRSPTLAVNVMVPNSLGPAELILKYGTDSQKQHYLPRLAIGEEIPCFALTSEKAGSDATSIEDYGVVCNGEFEGNNCLGLRLNWSKRYITLAPVATLLGLAIKVFDPNHLLATTKEGEQTDLGITCVLIPTHLTGVNIGQRHNPMDIPFQNGPTSGEDVFIPMEYVIGGEKMVGQGWTMLVECLVFGRALSLPALASAASQVSLYTSSAYAQVRYQFARPLSYFEGIQYNLSEISADTYSLSAMRYLTNTIIDGGVHSSVISALIKYSSTETSRCAVNHAMDIHAGKAIIQGQRNYLSSVYRSIPIGITVEGANILTRSLIVFSQGVLRCHPFLLDEINCIERDKESDTLQIFDRLLTNHIRYHLTLLLRVLKLSFARALQFNIPKLHGCAKYFRRANHMSAMFGYLADLTVISFGSRLKQKEMISGRFADALSMIYTTSSILKYYSDRGAPSDEYDMVRLVCERSLYRAQTSLYDICNNLPIVLSIWAKLMMFPLGRQLNKPSDKLRRKVAKQISQSDELRQRCNPDIYPETFSILERALRSCRENEKLLKKITKYKKHATQNNDEWLDDLCQQGIININQKQELKECYENITQAIRVDAFEKL